MEINSLADLDNLETHIAKTFGKLKLNDVLKSLYLRKERLPKIEPFVIAGVFLFAVRFSMTSNLSETPTNCDIESLINLYYKYYTDPITFDNDLSNKFKSSNLNKIFTLVRLRSSQFPFNRGYWSQFSRPFFLFHEIPKQLEGLKDIPTKVRTFDFESKFQAITGVSLIDFITTGFVISAECRNNLVINRNNFKKLREDGINLPDDESVRNILSKLTAEKFKLIELYERRKNKDRRFRMYDFNPLLSYPIIRLYSNKEFFLSDEDYIHAPIPHLIDSKMSMGIYYEMFNNYTKDSHTEFSDYFGYVFEKYVGLIIKNSISSEELISEEDIRKFYPKNKRNEKKIPDWALIDGSTLILFECKATFFKRPAEAIASEEIINNNLEPVIKGLVQLFEFGDACQSQAKELTKFRDCTKFKSILVSLEPLHFINTSYFREHIDSLLIKKNVTDLDWQILSIDELERLQPHLAAGFKLTQVLNDLWTKTFDVTNLDWEILSIDELEKLEPHLDGDLKLTEIVTDSWTKAFNEILQDLESHTHKTFFNSFLYAKHEELYQRINYKHNIK